MFRNIIVGVLATLNNKLYWYNRISETESKKIEVPFYMSISGQERFLQDNFLNDPDYDPENEIAISMYNQIPRAIVDMTGFSISTESMSNRFVRGTYTKENSDGTLGSYSSEFVEIPLNLPFEITVFLDSRLDMFKCSQRIIETFYKNNTFNIDVDGVRIPGVIKFPEEIVQERTVEFSFTDKKEWKLTFSVEVELSYPLFKNAKNGYIGASDTEMDNANRMVNISMYNIWGATAGIIGSTGSTATSNIYLANNMSGQSITNNISNIIVSNSQGGLNDTRAWPLGPSGGSTLPPN